MQHIFRSIVFEIATRSRFACNDGPKYGKHKMNAKFRLVITGKMKYDEMNTIEKAKRKRR